MIYEPSAPHTIHHLIENLAEISAHQLRVKTRMKPRGDAEVVYPV